MTEVEEHNAALEKVTDFVEEKELDNEETQNALSSLADPAQAILPAKESRYVHSQLNQSVPRRDSLFTVWCKQRERVHRKRAVVPSRLCTSAIGLSITHLRDARHDARRVFK